MESELKFNVEHDDEEHPVLSNNRKMVSKNTLAGSLAESLPQEMKSAQTGVSRCSAFHYNPRRNANLWGYTLVLAALC